MACIHARWYRDVALDKEGFGERKVASSSGSMEANEEWRTLKIVDCRLRTFSYRDTCVRFLDNRFPAFALYWAFCAIHVN
jgi:hypothetical protein